jgi:hypothetical protein
MKYGFSMIKMNDLVKLNSNVVYCMGTISD